MNHNNNKSPTRHQVDWDNPELKLLLDKTEGWGLDNRGSIEPIACDLHVGWGASVGKPATLVFENSGVLVIKADFIISPGEHVRIDRLQAGVHRSSWGVVAEGRPGHRSEDRANAIQLYWVHAR